MHNFVLFAQKIFKSNYSVAPVSKEYNYGKNIKI